MGRDGVRFEQRLFLSCHHSLNCGRQPQDLAITFVSQQCSATCFEHKSKHFVSPIHTGISDKPCTISSILRVFQPLVWHETLVCITTHTKDKSTQHNSFFCVQCRVSYESYHTECTTKGAGDKRGGRGKDKMVGNRDMRSLGEGWGCGSQCKQDGHDRKFQVLKRQGLSGRKAENLK